VCKLNITCTVINFNLHDSLAENSIIKMFIFGAVNTWAISRVYIRSLTPALPATATYKFSLSFSSCIVHYAHNSSLYSYAFSFRGILIQIYENCDDLWRNFIRRRKTVIFLNSCRMCCACFALHTGITISYVIYLA
jgi:hypothetical protein